MKLAVLADLHSNHFAFERCVEYALRQGVTTFLFLGDYLGDLACPQKTMQLLYRLNDRYDCHFVKGNKEDYWLDYKKNGETGWKKGDSTTGTLLYTYRQLTERDLAFFASLPLCRTLSLPGGPPLTLCHGTPESTNDKFSPGSKRTYALMDSAAGPVILCGHTHIRQRLEHKGRLVLNPGGVGTPLHSGGKTQFLILESAGGRWAERWVSLDYDVEGAIRELHDAGLDEYAPCWCRVSRQMLRNGEISHGTVLNRAMELCRAQTGSCVWPHLPERCWEQAVAELVDGRSGL